MSVRKQLEDALRILLPKRWKIVATSTTLDAISADAVVMLKQLELAPAPRAPRAETIVSYVVTIIDPHEDLASAETALDDGVVDLFRALQRITFTNPTKATKVTFSDQYLAYDLTVEVVTTTPKEKTDA